MMLNKGGTHGVPIIKPETVELMSRNHLPRKIPAGPARPSMIPNMGFGLDFAVRTKWARGAAGFARRILAGAASTQMLLHRPEGTSSASAWTRFMPSSPLYFQDARKKVIQAVLEWWRSENSVRSVR